jgi:PAS domain S-box-containing protein
MANYGGATVSMLPNNYNRSSATTGSGGSQPSIPAKPGLPTGGIRTAFHTGAIAPAPAPKKSRPNEQSSAPLPISVLVQQQQLQYSQQQQQLPQQQQQAMVMPQTHVMYGGLQHPVLLSQPQIAGATTSTTQPMHIANVASSGGIALPVGVGIRLGGIGGIVPATDQSRLGQPVVTGSSMFTGGQYGQGMLWNNNIDPSEEGLSEEAITERRQRNREHAKRSRVRKKFMLESLQEEVRGLQRENNRLRMLVQEQIPENAMQIISECCTHNPLFGDSSSTGPDVPSSSAGGDATGSLERSDFSLMQSLAAGQKCFVLSDPKLPDNPIVFATPDFYKLTGYTSEEVLGRNCRFLQGPGTDKRAIEIIRKAVSTGSDATVCLINYKADGTPFWNQFFIAALRDSDNNIVNFVSVLVWVIHCRVIDTCRL